MKKLVRILLGLVLLLVILGVAAIFFIGSIVKAGVEKVGPRVAKVPVKLDLATISIFNGSGELKGFVIGNPEGYKTPEAIKVGKMGVSIAPGSLLAEKKHVRYIRVEGPEITYETDLKGSNLGKLLDNVSGSAEQDKKAPTKEQQTSKTKLQVDEFVITGAKVNVNASVLGSSSAAYAQSITLPEIRLEKMGEGPEGITPAELSKKVLTILLNETVKAVGANAGKLEEAGKALGTGAIDQLKKSGGGISDLLKKKE
jgi:uncharacterized protein involved in outer membrane biogenesis